MCATPELHGALMYVHAWMFHLLYIPPPPPPPPVYSEMRDENDLFILYCYTSLPIIMTWFSHAIEEQNKIIIMC